MASKKLHQPLVLKLQQRLDMEGGKVLQKQLAAISHQTHNVWVIDMTDVDFIDSTGLFALVAGLKAARQLQCRFVICNLKETAKLIFEITQLERVFEIFDTYDDVLAMLEREAMPAKVTATAATQALSLAASETVAA